MEDSHSERFQERLNLHLGRNEGVLSGTMAKDALSILCWNVGNPSAERARKQAEWLSNRPEDVFVLTEVKSSEGCLLLERHFKFFRDCEVMFQKPDANEYGVMIISRMPFVESDFSNKVTYLRQRVASVRLVQSEFELEIIGLYVPTTGLTEEKAERKRAFIREVVTALDATSFASGKILCGDLNILEPNHVPSYPNYHDWEYLYTKLQDRGLKDAFRQLHPEVKEYSWVGHSNDGYRFDHSFVSSDLLPSLKDCRYLHETRESRLSDHSALITEFLPMKET